MSVSHSVLGSRGGWGRCRDGDRGLSCVASHPRLVCPPAGILPTQHVRSCYGLFSLPFKSHLLGNSPLPVSPAPVSRSLTHLHAAGSGSDIPPPRFLCHTCALEPSKGLPANGTPQLGGGAFPRRVGGGVVFPAPLLSLLTFNPLSKVLLLHSLQRPLRLGSYKRVLCPILPGRRGSLCAPSQASQGKSVPWFSGLPWTSAPCHMAVPTFRGDFLSGLVTSPWASHSSLSPAQLSSWYSENTQFS